MPRAQKKIDLMYFSASWCGPCKMMKPLIDSFINRNSDKVNLMMSDVDSDRLMAQAYQINSVPAFVVLKDGALVDRFNGMVSQARLNQILN
jgi:thioredoxin 1